MARQPVSETWHIALTLLLRYDNLLQPVGGSQAQEVGTVIHGATCTLHQPSNTPRAYAGLPPTCLTCHTSWLKY